MRVLGGGLDVGRSCFLLTLGHRKVLLDCGAHPGFADTARRFPDLASLPSLDAVLITHFHLDHAGALPFLRAVISKSGHRHPPVVMTAPTRQLSSLMLQDFFLTSRSRKQELPFSENHVHDALTDVVEIELSQVWSPESAPDIEISAHYAGHVLGSVMFCVFVIGVGSVVYSGDYSTAPDRYLRGAELPVFLPRPDLFITESTYCSTVRRTTRAATESELFQTILDALNRRAKILIPVAALGRAQELLAAFAALWEREDLYHVPVYVSAGLMSKAATVHDVFARQWCSSDAQSDSMSDDQAYLRLPSANRASLKTWRHAGVSRFQSIEVDENKCDFVCGSSRRLRIQEFHRSRDWHMVTREGPMVLFATPGNLSTGVSFDVFKVWCGSLQNVVVVPGYCFSNTLAGRLLAGGQVTNVDGIRDCRCKLVNLSFNSHVDARGIIRTIRRIRPRAVMLVHGEESKIKHFHSRMEQIFGSKVAVHSPANGTTINISMRSRTRFSSLDGAKAHSVGFENEQCSISRSSRISDPQPSVDATEAIVEGPQNINGQWRSIIEQYERGHGPSAKRVFGSGSATVPVSDGIATMSRLYADLLPNVKHVATSCSELTYKDCVNISLDRAAGLVKVCWDHQKTAAEARLVLNALDTAASPPGSPAP